LIEPGLQETIWLSSRVVGFGIVSDEDSKVLPKIEIALMALAVMVFVLRNFW